MWSISLSNIITWGLTIVIAGSVFWFYRRRQLKVNRLTILRSLEQDITAILMSKTVQVHDSSSNSFVAREFASVLDNRPPWSYEEDPVADPVFAGAPRSPSHQFLEGQRHWLIRKLPEGDKQYLASQAFQESLLWFRRIARAYKDRVVTKRDLGDLWRHILPFGFAGRISYFARYFQDKEDIGAMVFVINETLKYCLKHNRRTPVHYFMEHVTEPDRQILFRDQGSRDLHSKLQASMGQALRASPIRAIFQLVFRPTRFVQKAVEHDIALSLETNKGLRERYPDGHLPLDRQKEYEDNAWDRTRKIRQSLGTGFAYVILSLAAGWVSGVVLRRVIGAPTPSVIVVLQMTAAGILLGATLGLAGWEIQSIKGRSLPEKVNRWIYRILYSSGTYILVTSLSWPQ